MEKVNSIKWLYLVPGRKKWYIFILMFLHGLHGASGVLYALMLRNIVDSATAHNKSSFWFFVCLTLLLVLAQLAVKAIIRWMNELSKSTFENIFKGRLINNILYKDFASVNAIHSGEWMNRITNDTVIVADSYVETLPGFIGMIVKLISALAMMLILEWRFACLLIPCGVLLILSTFVFRKVLKTLHKNVQEQNGRLRIFLQEHISSMMIIRSFAAEHHTEAEVQERMAAHRNARMKKNRFSNLCNIGLGLVMNGMYLFGICYCGYGILIGTVSYGTLTAITQLISQVQSPFLSITGYMPRFYAMTASAERLMEIENFNNDSDTTSLDIQAVKNFYSNEFKSIGLKNAEFTYHPVADSISNLSKENQPAVLKNINFEVGKGECVALIGRSGCGKSTVLKVLMSIYPLDSGKCYLLSSSDEKKMTAEWHRLFAYVPQGNQLMSGTIREIVAFSDMDDKQNDKRINNALQIACADKFVSELVNGIDTMLGERGSGLSEGQLQRIAIARAIYSDSPILLLDEATSALDEYTEKQLLQNLRKTTDKTVLIVTHRPAVLEICDKIVDFSN